MPDYLEDRRLYGDKEMSRILKRAVELQQGKGKTDSMGRGISIGEIEQIARELGIDPRYVAEAAAEIERGEEGQEEQSLLGQTIIEVRRTVRGEISERQLEMMVQEIRRTFGAAGEIGQLGQSLEWKSSDKELISYHATISPRDGQTDIQITCWRDKASFLTYFLTAMFGILTSAIIARPFMSIMSMWIGLLIGAVVLAVSLTSARLILDNLTRKEKQRINHLMNRLDVIASEIGPAQIKEATSEEEMEQLTIKEETQERRPRVKDRA
jgi:hypothetical protein